MSKNEANSGGLLVEPLTTRPERIAIVALGRSCQDFILEMIGTETRRNVKNPMFDEVWTLNRGLRGIQHDKLFVMDDLQWLEKNRDKNYAKWLKKHDKPIITSTVYSGYPMSIAYPLQEVCDFIEDDIFTVNTVSYMLAYAMYIGCKHVSIYGADFFYPGGQTSEEGGQAVAYLLGMCAAGKMLTPHIPGSSSLLYACNVKPGPGGGLRREPYGYHRLAELEKNKAIEKRRKNQQRKK